MGRVAGMAKTAEPIQRRFAFIGTRDLNKLPSEAIEVYQAMAEQAAKRGHIITTGAALGADQLAANVGLASGGRANLYLPWDKYEKDWVDDLKLRYPNQVRTRTLNPSQDLAAMESLSMHPNPSALSQGVQKLHARNYLILDSGITPKVDGVFAIPGINRDGSYSGGTMQGLRLAEQLRIPSFNLSDPQKRQLVIDRYLS